MQYAKTIPAALCLLLVATVATTAKEVKEEGTSYLGAAVVDVSRIVPPPPEPGSAQAFAEIAELKQIVAARTPPNSKRRCMTTRTNPETRSRPPSVRHSIWRNCRQRRRCCRTLQPPKHGLQRRQEILPPAAPLDRHPGLENLFAAQGRPGPRTLSQRPCHADLCNGRGSVFADAGQKPVNPCQLGTLCGEQDDLWRPLPKRSRGGSGTWHCPRSGPPEQPGFPGGLRGGGGRARQSWSPAGQVELSHY